MRKAIYAVFFWSVFVACDPFSGTLQVQAPLTVNMEQNADEDCDDFDWDCDEWDTEIVSHTVQPGSYQTKLDFHSRSEVSLDIKVSSRKTVSATLKLTNGARFPETSGAINLRSNQIGQPFDVSGDVDTEYSRSEDRFGTDGCSYTRRVRVCDRGGDDHSGRGRRRGGHDLIGINLAQTLTDAASDLNDEQSTLSRCRIERETFRGTQDIEYYYEYENSTLSIDLLRTDSDDVLATYTGTRYESKRVVTYRGICF